MLIPGFFERRWTTKHLNSLNSDVQKDSRVSRSVYSRILKLINGDPFTLSVVADRRACLFCVLYRRRIRGLTSQARRILFAVFFIKIESSDIVVDDRLCDRHNYDRMP